MVAIIIGRVSKLENPLLRPLASIRSDSLIIDLEVNLWSEFHVMHYQDGIMTHY
jgi:hypothetical protein